MVNFLQRIVRELSCFHNHGATFVRNIYGDEINVYGGKRSIWKCNNCQANLFSKYLDTPP